MRLNTTLERIFKKHFAQLFNKRTTFFRSFFIRNAFHIRNTTNGFTLAEVLITLGIIGMVAAMTLPTLVNKYQKRTYITGLQKFYTQISQVMLSIKQQTSCEDMSCMGFDGTLDTKWVENAKKLFKENYQILKFCYGSTTCEYEAFFVNGSSSGKIFTANEFAFKTSDGFIIKIMPWSENWSSLTVDVNGPKRPNTIGRDIHLFRINKNGEVHPYYGYKYAQTQDGSFNPNLYWKTNPNLCNPQSTTSNGSYGCTARIIEEGWEMNF
ncbi:TPA: prepilin-type N-terminal cleavage/methylation domain-containing protein [Candidatus Scatousia excrementigallinarum]|uniref:Prepilin-type N-terminal cleavage/methylation domain-containing protein n=1 Tax=Candidatus Scatousia excrementigallinarum TaxID=2840935 RepID=A0A9D1EZ69_9BACT|nr:prepilin-type N-terminal cleavage/methylation domain-containing protein [Candidatus Scatousia excrementigallinarum]